MKFPLLLLLLLPIAAATQVAHLNETATAFDIDRFASPVVSLKRAAGIKMDAFFLGEGDSLFLILSGSGKGTATIDKGNETVLLLEGDRVITVSSVAVQSFSATEFVHNYRHAYTISPEAVELLSRYKLQRVRKYAMQDFTEIELEEGDKENFQANSVLFLQELERKYRRKAQGYANVPSFPGGKDAFAKFLNRNLRLQPPIKEGETVTILIQFDVKTNGSVDAFRVLQSAAPNYSDELLRVLKRMPRWKPAFVGGKLTETTLTQQLTLEQQDASIRVRL
jgi:hypothetical protein